MTQINERDRKLAAELVRQIAKDPNVSIFGHGPDSLRDLALSFELDYDGDAVTMLRRAVEAADHEEG